MTPQELYALWAPPESIWSPWVLPVPFAQLHCGKAKERAEIQNHNLGWLGAKEARDTALIVDLAGDRAIHFGLALLSKGFRPVPVIDGSPGPQFEGFYDTSAESVPVVTVEMRGLLRALCEGAEQLRKANLRADAPPAFLLDSKRMDIVSAADLEGAYDNRWMTFPQDFPSGKFLREHGIRRAILIHDRHSKQPQDDLAHVLRRWQDEGIEIMSKVAHKEDSPVAIEVHRPDRYKSLWYRVLAILGLRRGLGGGFGGSPWKISGAG